MDEKSKCDLPYGHFGRVEYDLDDTKWQPKRLLNQQNPFQLLRGPERLFDPARDTASNKDDALNKRQPPGGRRARQIHSLLTAFPEFQPAEDLLDPFLRTSEAVVEASSRHVPTLGTLLSFGNIRSDILHRTVHVAALALGDDANILRLIVPSNSKLGWVHEARAWLELPSLRGEETCWPCHGGPIQQVHFGQPVGHSDYFLAVRLLASTLLFRPRIRKSDSGSSSSYIEPNHLYSIGIEQTGGRIHADVDFNPWFPQQLGIVDAAGDGWIFEFDTRHMNHIARVIEAPAKSKARKNSLTLDDGWGRFSWVLSVEFVAICTRRSLRIFNIESEEPSLVTQIESSMFGAGSWFLDFLILPGHADHFCVLTSTHLAIYRVSSENAGIAQVRLQSKFLHHRNAEDLTLKVKVWQEGSAIRMVIFSNVSSTMTVYCLDIENPANGLIVEDPLDLGAAYPETRRDTLSLSGLHILPLQWMTTQRSASKMDGVSEQLAGGARFYYAAAYYSDGSLEEFVLYQLAGERKHLSKGLPIPRSTKTTASGVFLHYESFLVDGRDQDEEDSVRREPIARRTRRKVPQVVNERPSTDFEALVADLLNPVTQEKSVEDVGAKIKEALSTAITGIIPPLRALSDIAGCEVTSDDVQQASQYLEQCFTEPPNTKKVLAGVDDQFDARLKFKVSAIPLPAVTGVNNDLSLSSTYEQLVAKWISPLSPQIPGWVRLAKVDIARRVAADLVLSGQAMRVHDISEEETQDDQVATQPATESWDLPVRPGDHSSPMKAKHASQASALPTPSPTGTPSVTTASAHSTSLAAPELHRLGRYTSFSKPAPAVLPRGLRSVLSHWEIGEDLQDYEWMSRSKKLAMKDEDADEEMNEKDRLRSLRRAERHLRRQRKEVAASQAQQLATSQMTEIFTGSQPPAMNSETQPGVLAGSSQMQGPSQKVVASQVVPGRFGGRPPAKKKRKQGF